MAKNMGRMVPKRENKPRSPKFGERKIVRQKTSGKKFPDLSGDGKVTQKDILMGRGVIKKSKGGRAMPGMKKRSKKKKNMKKRVRKTLGGAMGKKKRVMKRGGGMTKKVM